MTDAIHLTPKESAEAEMVRRFLVHWRRSTVAMLPIVVAVSVLWRDYVPLGLSIAWCSFACANYLLRAAVCKRLERSAAQPFRSPWMRWLLFSFALSGSAWGLVPWILSGASIETQVFACLFIALLVFGVASAPGTPAMVAWGLPPMLVLPALELALRQHAWLPSAGFVLLGVVIFLFGLRVQTSARAVAMAEYEAKDAAAVMRADHQRRLLELERERTLLLERQRLMRDMHDGLGSALSSSLAAAERGQVRPDEVAGILRECLDDLRVVIDSLEPFGNDLVALLATLRFRLGSRLENAGVPLHWEMADLPALQWMGPSEALQVTRIVQEVLANVVKHAQCSCVRVTVTQANGQVDVCIADDGRGFDLTAPSEGRGLRSLRQRGIDLGGALSIESGRGLGTTVRLSLPVERQGSTAPQGEPRRGRGSRVKLVGNR